MRSSPDRGVLTAGIKGAAVVGEGERVQQLAMANHKALWVAWTVGLRGGGVKRVLGNLH